MRSVRAQAMLSIGHTVEDPSGVRQSTIYLCCDTSSDKFGKLLLVRTFPGEGGQACGHVHWCGDLSLVGLLDLLVDVADDPAPAKAKGKWRVRAANRPHHTPPPPGPVLGPRSHAACRRQRARGGGSGADPDEHRAGWDSRWHKETGRTEAVLERLGRGHSGNG